VCGVVATEYGCNEAGENWKSQVADSKRRSRKTRTVGALGERKEKDDTTESRKGWRGMRKIGREGVMIPEARLKGRDGEKRENNRKGARF